ncbi:L,D-transpeptidase family protein [Hyphomicrobium sp.]|uniref:L,D-transpeptidase family protein n=1 Tax=Hyphomicrobium sp. TaxID=82 RepID=UPI002D796D61|nr:L,D-transpeptidase family protein [Hyphomicrobium sp.]HET6388877.1 L,D-transpeptidase family protein [Hyphomicrobium sp.]
MKIFKNLLLGVSASVLVSELLIASPIRAEEATPPTEAAAPAETPAATATPAPDVQDDAVLMAVRAKLAAEPAADEERDRKDHSALIEFYNARHGEALWVMASGLKPEAKTLATEIENADSYGLDKARFKLPERTNGDLTATDTDALAAAEIQFSKAALLYARDARGGRIPDPAGMLSTNLDRRPQWIEPKIVIDALAQTHEPDAYLRSLQPQQPQFEKLRQIYLTMLSKDGKDGKPGQLSPAAKRIRANMEMWRWMWLNMGDFYVLNNIPEFMQYVYKDGQIIRSEKIVAGMLDKQSTIFSRPLKHVVLRPAWRVPESIMVNELWPNLIRGGGMMRQYGLQIRTKNTDKLVDYRSIDWSTSDIRDYVVMQPPGAKSVLGHVKFSFPSQHTIYMHDTPDKWMFKSAQRTLSHGCLRVQKPMQLAEMILKEDKGWDAAKIAELDRSGPLNNEISIEKEIPIHLVYFTAWVGEDGKLKTFRDVYGHEKRITLALDGKWEKISKGRDHLAPVEPSFNPAAVAARSQNLNSDYPYGPPSKKKSANVTDLIGNALGLSF